MSQVVDGLEEQPERPDSKCPECGGEPLPDEVLHRLSNLGYTHDDHKYQCSECGYQWSCGVPIGDFDHPEMAEDLHCDSCGKADMLVHRVVLGTTSIQGDLTIHLKCPNPDCHYFTRIGRDTDKDGRALMGYQQITGATEDARPYGYVRDESGDISPPDISADESQECDEPLCIEHGNGTLGCPLETED